jgi:uncharacterized membrane protein
LTRVETITALVHFYRGELYRSQNWRNRLDTTTNWAVVASLGILTFSLDNPRYAGEILIAGMYVNLVFLLLEARRFRFFDVWRSRVRMMEENFFGPILRRAPGSAVESWGEHVADDLLHPKFKITLQQAVKARLVRNYVYLFTFLLLAWLGEMLFMPPAEAAALPGLLGVTVPDWFPAALVIALYGGLLFVILFTPRVQPPEECYWPDPEHFGTDVSSLDT